MNSKPTSIVLRRLAKKIADKWQDLGAELGVDQSEMTCILTNNTQFIKPEEKAHELLLKWSQGTHNPTCGKLEKALERVGRHDVAVWLFEKE